MKKLEEGLLNRLTKLTNRSKAQTLFLFELCDFDFEKLLELERKLHNNFVFWVPGDKESRDLVLSMDYGSGWWDKMYGTLTWKKLKPMVRLVEIPELVGYMTMELEKNLCYHCGHLSYPDQLGIFWDKNSLCKWIQNKGGMPNFWMDKNLFEFARPFNEQDGTLLWDWNYERNKSLSQIKKEEEELMAKFQKKMKKMKEND